MEWYDDPVFDSVHETVDKCSLRGDEWRNYQAAKEEMGNVKIIKAAGTTYRPEAVAAIRRTTVKLVPDEDNEVDAHALRILVGDEFVGYVPKEFNRELSPATRAKLIKWGMKPSPYVSIAVKVA